MIATDSNFILGNLAGGMACGPVWTQFNLVFEAYPERLEREDNEGWQSLLMSWYINGGSFLRGTAIMRSISTAIGSCTR